jgi:WD40 repeat protein
MKRATLILAACVLLAEGAQAWAGSTSPQYSLFVSSLVPQQQQILQYNGTTGAFVGPLATFTGVNSIPGGLVFGPNGNLFVASGVTEFGSVLEYNGRTGAFVGDFVSPSSGGLFSPSGLVFGPNGDLFVASQQGFNVREYNGTTGAFVGEFVDRGSGGLSNPINLVFGPNGNLFVNSFGVTGQVLEYNGRTGEFVRAFVTSGVGLGLVFGPNGDLFVGGGNSSVLEYNGTTGAFVKTFVPAGNGGLTAVTDLAFGPNGDLFVAAGPPTSLAPGEVFEYNGTTGAYVGDFVTAGSGGLGFASYMTFGPAIVSTVPEPSAYLLFGIGTLPMISYARRRRKS